MIEVLKQALEALNLCTNAGMFPMYLQTNQAAITSLRQAIAELKSQEPVAWITPDGKGFRIRFSPPANDVPLGWDALYTHPPQRTEQDWDALAEKQAAAFERDGRVLFQDATVRAVHKVMSEFEAQPEQWGASVVTHPEYVAEQKRKTEELRSKLAQPEQEPVAWKHPDKDMVFWEDTKEVDEYHGFKPTIPLYTHPPQRTDKERILQLIKELRPAIKSLEGMGKGKTTDEWFDILVKDIEEKNNETI